MQICFYFNTLPATAWDTILGQHRPTCHSQIQGPSCQTATCPYSTFPCRTAWQDPTCHTGPTASRSIELKMWITN